jgi:hypothetical protein
LLILLAFSSCATVGGEGGSDVLASLDVSKYPGNVYVGISGPYSTKERMVEEAILSAAKSIHLNSSHRLGQSSGYLLSLKRWTYLLCCG